MGKMSISNVTSGPVKAPFSVVLYGTEGVGKSTWAASAPDPVFLDEPGGTEELHVARYPRALTWLDVLEAVDSARADKHEHKTFVLDTADWLEPLIWDHVCKAKGQSNIEDFGYGKGYVAAVDLWRDLLVRLEDLRTRRGMNVIILAHAHVRTFKNPIGEDFDTFELKLHAKASALLKEWPKAVLFARYETYTHKHKGEQKAKAIGSGARIIHTESRPGWVAKNRLGLPETMPLAGGWTEFETAARRKVTASPEDLGAEIAALLAAAAPDIAELGKASLARCENDPQKMAKLADWLRAKAGIAASAA